MRFSQIKAFHSVASYGGFSRAADAVFLTQPALSEHVKRLEQDHDVLLFHREKKRVRLTEKGEQLFVLTKKLFEIEQEVEEFLSASRSVIDGTLRIIIDSASHLTDYLGAFRDCYPDVFISMRTGNTEELLGELRAYNAEIGIVGDIGFSNEFDSIDLGTSPIVAIASKQAFSRDRRSLRLRDLASMPLVFREPGSKTRQKIEDAASRQRLKLVPAIEVEGREAMREVVASGIGIGFVSQAEFGNDDRIVSISLNETDLWMRESLVFLSQRKDVRVIRTFVEFIRSAQRHSLAPGGGAVHP